MAAQELQFAFECSERPMGTAPSPSPPEIDASRTGERLDSWKEIAAYLKRSVRTLHRWEKEEGLPVHRQLHKDLGSVFAYKRELDVWSNARSVRAELQETKEEQASPTRSRVIVAVTLAAVVMLIGSFSYMAVRRSRLERSARDLAVAKLELISTFPGSHRWPSLSPDGRMLAFVSDAGGTPQVWIKDLATGDPTQITFGDLPAVRPRWSADGDRIVYTRGGGIWSVALPGGEPRQIVEDGSNADLSPDGRHLVFERAGQIFIAGTDGAGASQLPRLPRRLIAHYGDSWPTFSPDGKAIAVFLAEEGRHGDYWIVPADGDEPRRITSDFQEGGAPTWTPDGKSLVVSSARAGSLNLWRVSVAGGAPDALTTGTGEDLDPVVSSDGRRVLFTNVKRTWDVVVHDLERGVRTTLLERRTPVVFPRYSPDGRRIAFSARNSRGGMDLFVIDAGGSKAAAVTQGVDELNIMPQWSGDGEALYFYQVRPTRTFRRISASGGASREIAAWSFKRQYQAAVDPRGRMIIYSSVAQGGLRQSRVRDIDTAREAALPFALFEQRFSRDGRLIAGESHDHEVVVCDIEGSCRTLTPKAQHGLTALAWSGDGTHLFFLRYTAARTSGELVSVNVEGGATKVYGSIGPFQRDFQMSMDVSPRQEVVYARYRESPHELWMAQLR